jgi:hypothetical protein
LDLIFTLAFGSLRPRTFLPWDREAARARPLAAPTTAAPPAISGIFALLAASLAA